MPVAGPPASTPPLMRVLDRLNPGEQRRHRHEGGEGLYRAHRGEIQRLAQEQLANRLLPLCYPIR
jgi:hypothetical protein